MGRNLPVWCMYAGCVAVLFGGCTKPQPQPPAKVPAAPAPAKTVEPEAPAVPAAADAAATPEAMPIDALLEGLRTAPDGNARVDIVDAIAKLGQRARPALDALVAVVADEDSRVRWHAARAIGLIGEDAISALPTLVKLLGDADPIVVTQAAAAIGMIRSDDTRSDTPAQDVAAYAATIDPLVKVTLHPDARVRRSALRALGALGPKDGDLAPVLIKQLNDSDPSVVLPALHSLADMDADAVPFLLKALDDPKGRYWATVALAEIGPEAAPAVAPLATLAEEGEIDERMQAILALAAIGEPATKATPQLVAALESGEELLRNTAAYALGRLRAAAADEPLTKAAADTNAFTAAIASWARARIHPDDEKLVAEAVQRLRKGLGSDQPTVRSTAAHGLSDLSDVLDAEGDRELINDFLGLLADPDPAVNSSAGAGLVRLGAPAVGPLLARLADPAVRQRVLEVIAALGAKAESAVPDLVKALGDPDAAFRGEAAVALAAVGPAAAPAVPELQKLLGGDTPAEVRYAAAYALGTIGAAAKPAVPRLVELSEADDEVMATVAAWAALKVQPAEKSLVEAAIPKLRKVLRGDRELARLEAAVALGDIGPDAAAAIPILELVAEEDSSRAVRGAAAEALAKIRPR